MTLIEKYNYNFKDKLNNYEKFISRQSLARSLVRYELFKKIIHTKGSIVECGVHFGGGLMNWAKLSSALEPYAIHRKVIGFDTFDGFPNLTESDLESSNHNELIKGGFKSHNFIYDEIQDCIAEYDDNRFLNQFNKVELVKGDANITIPKYIEDNQHLIISLLFLDFDIYEPTKTALNHFLKRMPKGSVIAFDEINNEFWKGETIAMMEEFISLNQLELKKFEFDPNIAYAVIQ
jgi:hypothetical protein